MVGPVPGLCQWSVQWWFQWSVQWSVSRHQKVVVLETSKSGRFRDIKKVVIEQKPLPNPMDSAKTVKTRVFHEILEMSEMSLFGVS